MSDEVRLPAIVPGTRLTDYFNVDLTVEGSATGGMGLVVWGPDTLLGGQTRALKLVRPDLASTPAAAAFEREALHWCGLWWHPYVVRAEGLSRLTNFGRMPALRLQYAHRGNLRSWLRQAHAKRHGSLKVGVGLCWAMQLALSLEHIHTPDPDHERPGPLIHADLKPENVLISDRGAAMLTDLGLARTLTAVPFTSSIMSPVEAGNAVGAPNAGDAIVEATTVILPSHGADAGVLQMQSRRLHLPIVAPQVGAHGPAVGTPPYMPPEQWEGIDAVVPASDVYALGVLLFELFAGVDAPLAWPHRPRGEGIADWYAAHLAGPMRRLADAEVRALARGPLADLASVGGSSSALAREVLDGLDALVLDCLARRVGDRPTAQEVRTRLGEMAERAGEGAIATRAVRIARQAYPRTGAREATYWKNRSMTASSLDEPEEMLRLSRRALEWAPEDAWLWSNVGTSLARLGDKARNCVAPDEPEEARRRYEEAEATFREAARHITLGQDAESSVLRASIENNRGNVLRYLAHYEAAVTAFEQSLRLQPDRPHVRFNLALALSDWAEEASAFGDHAVQFARLTRAHEEAMRAARDLPHNQQVQAFVSNLASNLVDLARPTRGAGDREEDGET